MAEKPLAVRAALGSSQAQVVKLLDAEEMIVPGQISEFEAGKREPSLVILLKYARAAGVCVDVLIDDRLELPARLPAKPEHS